MIILWAYNPVSTGVHAMPFIREARARGCKIIAIDPRQTRSTWIADWHVQPRPGTDGALALGMMKVIVDNDLHDPGFPRRSTRADGRSSSKPSCPTTHSTGSRRSRACRPPTSNGWRSLTARPEKPIFRAGHGLNRHQNSGQMCRAILLLPAITGAWRERCGGAGFGRIEENWDPFFFKEFQRFDLGDRDSKRLVNMVQMGQALG